MERLIAKVLKEQYCEMGDLVEDSPLQATFLRNVHHSKMDRLLGPIDHGETRMTVRSVSRISPDEWTEYIRRVKRMNANSLFKYLARKEGRAR